MDSYSVFLVPTWWKQGTLEQDGNETESDGMRLEEIGLSHHDPIHHHRPNLGLKRPLLSSGIVLFLFRNPSNSKTVNPRSLGIRDRPASVRLKARLRIDRERRSVVSSPANPLRALETGPTQTESWYLEWWGSYGSTHVLVWRPRFWVYTPCKAERVGSNEYVYLYINVYLFKVFGRSLQCQSGKINTSGWIGVTSGHDVVDYLSGFEEIFMLCYAVLGYREPFWWTVAFLLLYESYIVDLTLNGGVVHALKPKLTF